ncbi:hypothetical protein [Bacillus sp. MRMR6]|uniref:hypothetical protein n=1 Tax=Bacillus sp. MRMR6 TaxID=1928617 RepID=UPI0009510CE9|nr:hypothetical protein [Bacillus sp. MRMR6]OLS40529.1 hypothetical protein BTR25_08470 [Bacillus sp. MRMR6]
MILYHGSIKKFDRFHKEVVIQNLSDGIDTIGFWFTSNIHVAKPFTVGTETVIEKSKTEFWEDGEPKVIQYERPVSGFIYKVFIDEPNLKEYPSYDLFISERNKYCDYLGSILLNKEEANGEFRKSILKQNYDGFFIRNTILHNNHTDLYCIFSEDALYIADIIPIDN